MRELNYLPSTTTSHFGKGPQTPCISLGALKLKEPNSHLALLLIPEMSWPAECTSPFHVSSVGKIRELKVKKWL